MLPKSDVASNNSRAPTITSLMAEATVLSNGIVSDSDFARLPPILRLLLLTDGTLTRSLEALFWERVLIQIQQSPQDNLQWRRVKLIGSQSNQIYAYAESHINHPALEQGISEALYCGDIGIGELIRNREIESFRKICEIGFTQDITRFSDSDLIPACPFRRYEIKAQGQTFASIVEYFPLQTYLNV